MLEVANPPWNKNTWGFDTWAAGTWGTDEGFAVQKKVSMDNTLMWVAMITPVIDQASRKIKLKGE